MTKLRVKELLKENGLTQKDLAAKLGMSEIGLSKCINENGNPDIKRLEEFADFLNVPIIELFEPPKTNLIICPNCNAKFKLQEE